MFSLVALTVVRGGTAAQLRALDPCALSPSDAESAVSMFAELERLAAAGKALCAQQVVQSGSWQRTGDRSAADWLARTTGSTVGAARTALDVASRIEETPNTDEALRAGELSLTQADAITAAAKAAPEEESRLVELASRAQPVKKLQDECARVRAAATPDAAERHRQLHRDRFFRAWTKPNGARCGMYETTPEAAAEIEAEIRRRAQAEFERARKSGEHEPSEAYAADGLLAMARASRDGTGAATGERQQRPEAIVLVNLESLQRGTVEPGETCEIPGVGPVPVDVARELLTDALLRIVIRDGIDICTVVHAGRLASDAQRIAIQVRQRGRCLRDICGMPIQQVDHIQGFTITGATSLDELGGLCTRDHRLKTHHGHWYERNDDGTFTWHTPDERDEPPDEPPPPG